MHNLLLRFYLLVLLLLPTAMEAQVYDTLNFDPAAFAKEIADKVGSVKRDDCKEAAKLFSTLVAEEAIPIGWLKEMATVVPLLERIPYKPYPHLYHYLVGVNSAAEIQVSGTTFREWSGVVRSMLLTADVSRIATEKYLEFSGPFFKHGYLFLSSTRNWTHNSGAYRFRFDGRAASVLVEQGTLLGFTGGDSVQILDTRGVYFPSIQYWEGQGGTIRWENTGLDPQRVYAELPKYAIDFTKGEFNVDSAQLHYSEVFSEPMYGNLMYRLRTNRPQGINKYPEFNSYEKRIELPEFIPQVRYIGGFQLRGGELIGSGDQYNKAELHFLDNFGHTQAVAKAESFSIQPTSAASSRAELVVYLGEDSIVHPGTVLKYLSPSRLLTATKGKAGLGQAPFVDGYHGLEMHFERMVWDLDEPLAYFTMIVAGAKQPAYFTSTEFYDAESYEKWRGVMSYNPLQQIFKVYQQVGSRNIRADLIARSFHHNLSVDQVEHLLYQLVADGFIRYDPEAQEIEVLEKVDRYVLASMKAVDHDALRMKSETDTVNAILNMDTRELSINGVYAATLSARHFVHGFPSGERMKVYEGRDLSFGGTLFAGRLDMFGKDFYFNYDDYLVDLKEVDSMVINIPTGEVDEFGHPIMEPLKTVFEGLKGTIYLDDPDNKAGYKDIPGYPRLVNDQPSYAYYDKSSGLDSLYNRDEFFFEIDPFTIDSLNNFEFGTQKFSGLFHSGHIFPDLRQDLTLRHDGSLGFIHNAPTEGYALYRGIGRYYETIDLSNRGLRGNGRIDYLNASMQSTDLLFGTKRAMGLVEQFTMQKMVVGTIPHVMKDGDSVQVRMSNDSISYPSVRADSVSLDWHPYSDSMLVNSGRKPFDMFEGFSTLQGQLNLRKDGLQGKGVMDWAQADMKADRFRFGSFSADADTVHLRIKSADETKVALDLPNVKANLDFGSRKGTITNNVDSVTVKLPYMLYETEMARYQWDMTDQTLTLRPRHGQDFSYFRSMHKGQDSLTIYSGYAVYDMNTHELTIEEIPYIPVADVHVLPDLNRATVIEGAKIKTLENAEILMDSSRQQFRIVQATLDILGRNDMRGQGFLDYKDRSGRVQRIPLQEIGVHNTSRSDTIYTYARGVILDTLNFELDPQILYKGDVQLHSREDLMRVDGIARIKIADTTAVRSGWFRMVQPIDPNNISVDAYTLIGPHRDSIYSGFHRQVDSTNVYPTLLGNKQTYMDKTIFLARGQLKYDEATNTYTVADSNHFQGRFSTGNLFRYNNTTGDAVGEGITGLDLNFGLAKFAASGTIDRKFDDTLLRMNMMLALDFYLSDAVKEAMYNDLLNNTFNNRDIDPFNATFQKNLGRIVGDSANMAQLKLELTQTGVLTFPKRFATPLFVLSDVKMFWDEESGTYLVMGDCGLASFNGKAVGKRIKIYMEIGPRRSEDFFNLYLEGTNRTWYYVNYQNKKISLLTSSLAVNHSIMSAKPKERGIRNEEGQIQFGVATQFQRDRFYNQMLYLEQMMKGL